MQARGVRGSANLESRESGDIRGSGVGQHDESDNDLTGTEDHKRNAVGRARCGGHHDDDGVIVVVIVEARNPPWIRRVALARGTSASRLTRRISTRGTRLPADFMVKLKVSRSACVCHAFLV